MVPLVRGAEIAGGTVLFLCGVSGVYTVVVSESRLKKSGLVFLRSPCRSFQEARYFFACIWRSEKEQRCVFAFVPAGRSERRPFLHLSVCVAV